MKRPILSLQVAKEVLKRADDKVQISLIYCNQTPEDILLWEELKEMEAKHSNFKVWYVGEHFLLLIFWGSMI